jgi:succinyl-CoA synthetase beta subunit
VPNFHTPEACADAIAAALRRRMPIPLSSWPGLSPQVGSTRLAAVNNAELGQARVRVPSTSYSSKRQDVDARDKRGHDDGENDHLNDELEAYDLLKKHCLTCAPSLAVDADLTAAPALPFGYPVVAKALSANLAHKSDAGGVVLNITDGAALVAACQRIRANVAAHGHSITRVLVQPMISGVGEVLVGYRIDPDVGPLIMVAMGGIFTEIYRDRSLRLAPVDLSAAHEMIAEVRGLATLKGFRGKPKGDLGALARTIVALSRLAEDPTVLEAEINPLIVQTKGVSAVDAVVRLA